MDWSLTIVTSTADEDGTTTLESVDKLFKANDPLKLLENGFKQAGLKGADEAFEEAYLHQLNNQDWATIAKVVEFSDGDADVALASTITPAAQLGNLFTAYEGHGFASHAAREVVGPLAHGEHHHADARPFDRLRDRARHRGLRTGHGGRP